MKNILSLILSLLCFNAFGAGLTVSTTNGYSTNQALMSPFLRNYILTNGILTLSGNTRGTNTTDFQNIRNNTNQYAWARNSTISGGLFNRIDIEEPASVIAGGEGNAITNGVSGAGWDSIGGGRYNVVNASEYSSIPGGQSNNILGSTGSAIGGGRFNYNNGIDNTLGGGNSNYIQGENHYIGGGKLNMISGESSFATIGGGFRNMIGPDGGVGSFILGGENNQVNADLAGAIGNNITNNDFETIKIGKGTTSMNISSTGLVTAVAFSGNGAGITGIATNSGSDGDVLSKTGSHFKLVPQSGGDGVTNIFTRTSSLHFNVDNNDNVPLTFADYTNDVVVGFLRISGHEPGNTNPFDFLLHVDALPFTTNTMAICKFQGAVGNVGSILVSGYTDGLGHCKLTFRDTVANSDVYIEAFGTNMPSVGLTETNGDSLEYAFNIYPQDGNIQASEFDARAFAVVVGAFLLPVIDYGMFIPAGIAIHNIDLYSGVAMSLSGGANIDGGLGTTSIVASEGVTADSVLTFNSSSDIVAATGWTNILGRNAQVFITSATFAAINNQYGDAIMTSTPITSPFAFTMQTNWTLIGTGIVGKAQAW